MGYIIAVSVLVVSIVIWILTTRFGIIPMLLKNFPKDENYEKGLTKKKSSANVNDYTALNFFIGLNIALGFTILMISAESKEHFDPNKNKYVEAPVEEFEEIPITEIPPPPPPVIRVPEIIEVPDEEEIPDIEIEHEEEDEDPDTVEYVEPVFEEPEEEVVDDKTYNFFDLGEKPVFPGGEGALHAYVREHFKFPHRDREEENYGTIFVSFTIMKDGSVSNVKILRGINDRLNNETIRVIKSLPKWKPGKNAGSPVKVSFTMPVMLQKQ